ncbi:MAG: tetratricopeptide repeat protein, partial [Blastocatellia bacterium]
MMIRMCVCLLTLSLSHALAWAQTPPPANAPNVVGLAGTLSTARTPQERAALLDQHRAALSIPVQRIVLSRGDGLMSQQRYADARQVYETALQIATLLDREKRDGKGDGEGVAAAWNAIGSAEFFLGSHQKSLDAYTRSQQQYQALDMQKET